MKLTATFLLIMLVPSLCFANGKVAAIKKGQRAPFDGILLDRQAEATMTAKRESAVKICDMDKNFSIKKLSAECGFEKRLLIIERDTNKKKFSELMALKSAEVKRLNKALAETKKPDYTKLWFVGGFVVGVGLSIGIFYAAAEAAK